MTQPGERGEPWFAGVYTAHYRDVVRYGLRRLADADAAAELAQEVFVVAWRRREQVPETGLPWLYGVARRLLANQYRDRRVTPVPLHLDDPDRVPAGGSTDAVVAEMDLRAALGRLAEPDREILRLVGWEQLSIPEAAVVLGCTRATAAVRLHRARRRLRAALAGPPPGSRPLPSRTAPSLTPRTASNPRRS